MTDWAQYLQDHADSPYGEAVNAWDADAETLRAFDSEALDEAAQIARMHARMSYRAPIAQTLHAFRADCDVIRRERMGL